MSFVSFVSFLTPEIDPREHSQIPHLLYNVHAKRSLLFCLGLLFGFYTNDHCSGPFGHWGTISNPIAMVFEQH